MQTIIVYMIVALAVGGACRYFYRKLRTFRKSKRVSACLSCPLKDACKKIPEEKKKTTGGTCCH